MQVALLFLCVSASYQYIVRKENIQWFQAMYYLSSFFGLFGSHTTSFLLAGALWHATSMSFALGMSGRPLHDMA